MEMNGAVENYVAIENQKIELKGVTLLHMDEVRKWTRFMSILGFVAVGLLFLLGIVFIITFLTRPPMQLDELGVFFGPWMGIFYIVFAVIYFFPVLYMYRFSLNAKRALVQINSDESSNEFMAKAIVYLKKHFRYVGIFTIIFLVVYLVVFIGIGIAMLIK
jgi:hypothetical protein